jgi:hypothetical protein
MCTGASDRPWPRPEDERAAVPLTTLLHMILAAPDIVARVIGISGIALAAFSIALTWYLWHRSGPRLKVTAFVRAETGTVQIEVVNAGRLSATIRQIELRDHFVLRGSAGSTEPTSRWAIPARARDGVDLPRELAPSAYLEADVDVKAVLEKADRAPTATVRAATQRGDGRWVWSKPFRVR